MSNRTLLTSISSLIKAHEALNPTTSISVVLDIEDKRLEQVTTYVLGDASFEVVHQTQGLLEESSDEYIE